MYITKQELQTFTDATSLAGTLELDGTPEGIYRAKSLLASDGNRWNFHTTQVSDDSMAFAKDKAGPWETTVIDPRGYRYASVSARAEMQTYFLPNIVSPPKSPAPLAFLMLTSPGIKIHAISGAGQEPKDTFREGLFPFSPYAHNTTASPHFGLSVGQKYTLRWASAPKLHQNTCSGDDDDATMAIATAGGGDERGFIESTSSDLIRATIEQDYQTVVRSIGDQVSMTGGTKQTQLTSLINRINQDADRSSSTFAQYSTNALANGRRIVAVPINTGAPDYRIVQIGAFMLLPAAEYSNGGNKAFCAEYVGAWVQGSNRKGAADSGAYVAKLIR